MKRFALVDCNNFFVSCERVFNPKLIGKPVVVLSSNDACVIARSNEAKKLGIKMGEPVFTCQEIFKKYNVIIYSSNFPLYGDMSARVMQTLTAHATDIELYSVDEAFLYFPRYCMQCALSQNESEHYLHYAHFLKNIVKQYTGIPVSIGIGPTKTLAKIANHIAKKNLAYHGVFDITDQLNQDNILKNIDVADIWGIGYRYAKFLYKYGITNAYDLKNKNDTWIRKHMTINGLKTVLELRGIVCLNLDDAPQPRKSITVSRAFGKNVTSINELQEALAYHVSTAAAKVRAQQMRVQLITVFICFTQYQDAQRFYASTMMQLSLPTSYTPYLISYAQICLQKLFKKGTIYKKIGVILDDFVPEEELQMHAFIAMGNVAKQQKIMQTIDSINNVLGRNTVCFAASGIKQNWHAKRAYKTPSYTTNWHEILKIKI